MTFFFSFYQKIISRVLFLAPVFLILSALDMVDAIAPIEVDILFCALVVKKDKNGKREIALKKAAGYSVFIIALGWSRSNSIVIAFFFTRFMLSLKKALVEYSLSIVCSSQLPS